MDAASGQAPESPETSLARLASALDRLIAQNRAEELERLHDALNAARMLAADAVRERVELQRDRNALAQWKSSKTFRYTQRARSAYAVVITRKRSK